MDILVLLPAILFFCWMAFCMGQYSKEFPSEEEMIRRLKELRYARKMVKEADGEVEEMLKR